MCRIFKILIVEDNPGDVILLRHVLQDEVRCDLSFIENGADAVPFLRGQGKYVGAPRPDLILLDLNLPCRSGHEILDDIKRDWVLRPIPVIVFSSSSAVEDIQLAYDLHANSYIQKPDNFDGFERTVKYLKAFWFEAASLPGHPTCWSRLRALSHATAQ